ncbi:hypothetical protein [Rhizobium leguminosarum]|uniref:hypothetical protein n=1 Tax=Rhizobium leguminosarum TaxID=384 RepID=UPI001C95BC91|nr:hypothetical protein [Rhizobium leguminosarum]
MTVKSQTSGKVPPSEGASSAKASITTAFTKTKPGCQTPENRLPASQTSVPRRTNIGSMQLLLEVKEKLDINLICDQ